MSLATIALCVTPAARDGEARTDRAQEPAAASTARLGRAQAAGGGRARLPGPA